MKIKNVFGNNRIHLVLALLTVFEVGASGGQEEEEAAKWFAEMEPIVSQECNKAMLTSWEANARITPENLKAHEVAAKHFNEFRSKMQLEARSKFSNWRHYKNKRLRRAFKYITTDGPGNMTAERMAEFKKLTTNMQTWYSTATVCEYRNASKCDLKLREIEGKLKSSDDLAEQEYYWTSWHDKMSSLISPSYYHDFIQLLNEKARANGFSSECEVTLSSFDDDTEGWTPLQFEREALALADDVSKIFAVLHAYVRMKLRRLPKYKNVIEECGFIPVHVTGNMWAQGWTSLDKLTKPFPTAPKLDATDAMIKKGYTPLRMFQEADRFFRELGLKGMSQKAWENSILEKPDDGREIGCHASAWDTCSGKGNTDFRIKQCTLVGQSDFVTIHHEMGHIEYFQQYTDLEFPFRNGANHGFHEAIGDSLALAVVTPNHLQCKLNLDLGLGDEFCQAKKGPFNITETDINYLYMVALDKLAFFPFAACVDFFRWWVYGDRVSKEDYNKLWWRIRGDFQGIKTPKDRSSSSLFDPVAKYHVVANVDYIRYFVSYVLQFQFYEAMCIAAKEYDPNDPNSKPLFQCDFSGSKEAGKLIGDMMKMGFSQGWPDALEAMTGSRKMSIKPLQRYLKPLLDFMEAELKKNGETIGFGDSCEEVKKRNGRSRWADLVPKSFWTVADKRHIEDAHMQEIIDKLRKSG